ncbi:MAG: TspO/MBR family protein [Parachlamydiaceae bacterium]
MAFYKRLILSLLLCVGGGWLSGLITRQGICDWYHHLNKPIGTPPEFVFPIVWTLLYILMAIAVTFVWSSESSNKRVAIFFFILQLALNFSWSFIFFGLRSPGLAIIDLFLLWNAILGTLFTFKEHSSIGCFLLLPYFAWVSYAIYLNVFIWVMN